MELPPDDKVKRLPVRFKARLPEERTLLMLHEVGKSKCNHLMVSYIVDQAAAEVECGRCGEKLNPMWVLMRLCADDRRWAEARALYQEEQKRLAERQRTKCEHCDRMTRISRR